MMSSPEKWKDSASEMPFERKKQEYFTRLGLRLREAIRAHARATLLEKKDGKREWGNVSEHCLVEAARAGMFARKLQLSPEVALDMELAAAIHDTGKKTEILLMRQAKEKGMSMAAACYEEQAETNALFRDLGFSERVITIAGSVGAFPEVQYRIKAILDKERPTDAELAVLVMHYIDAYARGSDWAEPAAGGVNDIDRRYEQNKRYGEVTNQIFEEYASDRDFFEGKNINQFMSERCHVIEEKLAARIQSLGGEVIPPLDMPEAIDSAIRQDIESPYI